MAVPSSPGFDTNGPIAWDTVRSELGVSGAQNINSLMTNANIGKWSFYRPGGIEINSGDQSIDVVTDTAPYKWGDWRNYWGATSIEPEIPASDTLTYLEGQTSATLEFPIFWQYLNVKQLSTSITHVMVEVWTSPAKTGFVGRAHVPISWITESSIPDHSTTQTQRPAPGGTTPQVLTLTINPQIYESQSPLYAECWMTDVGQNRRAHFDKWTQTITLNEQKNPTITGGDLSPTGTGYAAVARNDSTGGCNGNETWSLGAPGLNKTITGYVTPFDYSSFPQEILTTNNTFNVVLRRGTGGSAVDVGIGYTGNMLSFNSYVFASVSGVNTSYGDQYFWDVSAGGVTWVGNPCP